MSRAWDISPRAMLNTKLSLLPANGVKHKVLTEAEAESRNAS
jgi:hypothetical protein